MARHGENIRKRADGRWEARYQTSGTDKGRKAYRSVYGSTYEEAKKKRDDAVRKAGKRPGQMTGGGDMPGTPILFSQAAAGWLEEISGNLKHSTYVKYNNIYRKHLEKALGSIPLSGMSGQEIQERISEHLLVERLSDSIRKSVCCVTKQILEFAGEKYSVCAPMPELSAGKPMNRPVETFSKDEQSRLLACVYNGMDRFKAAILLCLYTGMRLGELCALKWTDFDFRDRMVAVNRTVQRITTKEDAAGTVLMETAPKSESSRRTIPLTDEMAGLLKGIGGDGEYVFGGDRPLEPRTMQYQMKRILREACVENRNFHILRHTFATNCVESGMDVKTLSVLLGHSDVKITLNRYVHPTMESKRKQIGRLPDFYGQIRGQAD